MHSSSTRTESRPQSVAINERVSVVWDHTRNQEPGLSAVRLSCFWLEKAAESAGMKKEVIGWDVCRREVFFVGS